MEYDDGFQFLLNTVKQAGQFTVPLYKMNLERKYPEFVGSSLYCSIGPFAFLFTAAHVVKDIWPQKPMYPSSEHLFIEIPCDGFIQNANIELDIGIILLKSPLTMWNPVNEAFFSGFNSSPQFQHLLLGYPGSYTKRSDRDKQISVLKGYLTSASEDIEYEKRHINKSEKLIVEFKKEKVFEEKRKLTNFPDPNGMSGGPVIQFNENNPLEMKIVGILDEWDPNKKNIIIANRIEKYIELIMIKKIDLTTAST